MFLEHMDSVVKIFNHNHSHKLDHGVDPDKYYKKRMEARKTQAPPSSKPQGKTKTYNSTSNPESTDSSDSSKKTSGKTKTSVRISASYGAPELKKCRLCNGQHTHIYYCEQYYKADIQVDRIKVAQKLQVCFRCLRMDATINFNDRVKWVTDHAVNCQSDWVCKVDNCANRAKERQYHFTLCKWHTDENKKIQNEFIKALDQAQTKPGISFFFNTPQIYSLEPRINQFDQKDNKTSILEDVYEPSIFMLQEYTVNDRNLLVFYDSGCLGSAMSDRAAQCLNSVCVREGPTSMNVAGGKTVMIEGGDEQFLLNLVSPNTKATITALRMPQVTTPFPLWNVAQAWNQISNEYRACCPSGEDLPPAPKKIGGVEVDLMIGIRYQKYFPVQISLLPCGLGIYRSKIAAPRGEITVLGGPHPAWRNALDKIGFFGATSFFTAEARALRVEYSTIHHVHHPVQHEAADDDGDVIVEVPLGPDVPAVEQCLTQHCDKHGDLDAWIVPLDWDIDGSIYGLRQDGVRFAETELIGSEVTYRCVRCRNCNKCKQGESLETASLREEQEQYLIDQSVTFDPSTGSLTAKLPFIADPASSLRPNRYTAEKILASQIKQLSKDEQAKQDVLAAHEKLRSRGYVVPLADLSTEEQNLVTSNHDSGYIIPWRSVWKQSSLSTPCRLVFDASSKTPGGESLNNILAKGENKLIKIHNVLLRFRCQPGAFTCDVKMAYNQINLDSGHYRYQQYLWRPELDPENPVVIMVVRTLIYGVRSAGNQLFAGFEKVADDTILHYPEHTAGAEALKRDGYVDDVLHAAPSHDDAKNTAASLDFVLRRAGLAVKAYTFAGSPPAEEVSSDGVHVGLVGLLWDPVQDVLNIDVKDLFFGKSKRGVLPAVVVGDFTDALRQNFTRRNLLGKVAGVYDPIGLLTPITAGMKLDLHDLCLDKLDWDDPVPEEYLEKWVRNLNDIQALKEVKFRRTVIPPDAASLEIDLIISSDASKSIAISCVHARVPLLSGGFSCQLLIAKSKIVRYDTVPRAELRAAVMSSSLSHSVKHNLQSLYSSSIYVTDSTIVLHWLNQDERPLDTAVRNSVIEIRRLTDVTQWYHIDGVLNIADLGTRQAEISEIRLDSDWQCGKEWMRLPVHQMPIKSIDDINLSSEERRLASQESKVPVMFNVLPDLIPKVAERYRFSKYILDPNKYSWDKGVRVLGYVLRFLRSFKKSTRWSPVWFPSLPPRYKPETLCSPFLSLDIPLLSDYDLSVSENYFFYKSTLEVLEFSPDKEYRESFIVKNGIYHYVGRILDSQEISSPEDTMFDLAPLSFVRPIIDRHSPVGYSVMLYAHQTISHHRSATASLLESRSIAFILRGRDLATEVVKSCRPCGKFRSKLVEVEMGKLHQTRLTIAPVFHCVQVDLFGPINAICEHQHRSTVKVYGVVFKDPGSCALAIHVMQNYTTAAFLQAYTRFASRYGHPTELRIDEGSQLMSACKKMRISMVDITNNLSVKHQVGIKHSTCAVAAHNAHGMVERSIQEIKKLFKKLYKGQRMDILSLETCFGWISSELNNLPICIGSRVDNLDHVDLITPSRLLLGRNNRRALGGYATLTSPSRLIDQMDKIYEVWWKVWKTEKLVDFIPQPSKWKKTNEQLQVGDIVIFQKSAGDAQFGEPVWKIARVRSVDPSEDGLARDAILEYRNPDEKVLRTTNRSVRTVVVLHREKDLDVIQALEKAAQEANLQPQPATE